MHSELWYAMTESIRNNGGFRLDWGLNVSTLVGGVFAVGVLWAGYSSQMATLTERVNSTSSTLTERVNSTSNTLTERINTIERERQAEAGNFEKRLARLEAQHESDTATLNDQRVMLATRMADLDAEVRALRDDVSRIGVAVGAQKRSEYHSPNTPSPN